MIDALFLNHGLVSEIALHKLVGPCRKNLFWGNITKQLSSSFYYTYNFVLFRISVISKVMKRGQ